MNPASLALFAPGTHTIQMIIRDSGGNFVRSETFTVTVNDPDFIERNVARQWNERNLEAIRIDFPNPTAHARNLFHTSVAMWDAWAAYDPQAVGVIHHENATSGTIAAARDEAISFAAYRVLHDRYQGSVNGSTTTALLDLLMVDLGYNSANTTTIGSSPAAVGNRVAEAVLLFSSNDGWNNLEGFLGGAYTPVNGTLPVAGSGTVMTDPNRWQPLLFENAITQNGQQADLIQSALGPHWGAVRPWALTSLVGGNLHIDPGPPPFLGVGSPTLAAFQQGNVETIARSGLLGPEDGNMIDISPGAYGNSTLGTNDGTGHEENPATGQPYAPNLVNHADFGRILAEFWADGPHSETPPGHWNTLANEVADTPGFQRKFEGLGTELDPLEWDVKTYLALNGAMHDSAIAAWGCKRVYDFVRPVSSIRYMGGLGQSSDIGGPSYHELGLPLVPNLIEVVTAESVTSGRHAGLTIGMIAVRAWTAKIEPKGVHWHHAVDWLPYQRTTFVTPAFPGYVSGHSTFSRAGAEIMTRITGSAFFPGGMGTYTAEAGSLEFDGGPSADIELQWATYYDAADQAGLSRLYGGIHVPADDGPGRVMGSQCGINSWNLAIKYFDGSIEDEPFASRLVQEETQRLHTGLERDPRSLLSDSGNRESGDHSVQQPRRPDLGWRDLGKLHPASPDTRHAEKVLPRDPLARHACAMTHTHPRVS